MIKNLQLTVPQTVDITFEVITEVGKCKCEVRTNELSLDVYPRVYVTDYEVLGVKYEEAQEQFMLSVEKTEAVLRKVMNEGITKLSEEVRTICENNNWSLWSY